jgi:CheY-like chemotaxis protein
MLLNWLAGGSEADPSRESGGLSMSSTSRDRFRLADSPLVLNGPEGRKVLLRILFFHSDAAVVERCVQELRKSHLEFTADVVLAPEELARQLKSKYYDVVLAEYAAPNWNGPRTLEILNLKERQIPCIFLTDTIQPETMAELVTQGAAGCVGMDDIGHLPLAIRQGVTMSDLSDYYRKRALFRVVVITREEKNKPSGEEDENVYEAIVAARGEGFVKMSVHHLIRVVPRGERITVLSEVEISEAEYNELAK